MIRGDGDAFRGIGNDSGAAGEVIRRSGGVDPDLRESFGIARETFRGMGKSSWEKRLHAIGLFDGRNSGVDGR